SLATLCFIFPLSLILFSSLLLPSPFSTLFPYTTLFRSTLAHCGTHQCTDVRRDVALADDLHLVAHLLAQADLLERLELAHELPEEQVCAENHQAGGQGGQEEARARPGASRRGPPERGRGIEAADVESV